MEEAVRICLKHSWLYDCKMTEIFLHKPWQRAPSGWHEALSNMDIAELKDLVSGCPHNTWPDSLQEFCRIVRDNSQLLTDQWAQSIALPSNLKVGMNVKKQHEVSKMAPLISDLCKDHACSLVGDIGCGLGYLGQVLTSACNLDVMGFELKYGNCQSVRKPQPNTATCNSMSTQLLCVDTSPQCTASLHSAFKQHRLSHKPTQSQETSIHRLSHKPTQSQETSIPTTENVSPSLSASKTEETDRVCIVGLHCCGDLTPATLHQFISLDECKAMVCLGCCYHRLRLDGTHLTNFPMSRKLKEVYANLVKHSASSINTLALRLACQETKSRWLDKTKKEMEEHSQHVCYRGVLEHCCHMTGSHLIKKRKRLVGISAFSSFDTYTDVLLQRVQTMDTDILLTKTALMKSYDACKSDFSCIRWYNALQVMLQQVLESIILLDRKSYITERGHHCQLVSVFDDKISPRSIAIVAYKT